MLLTELASLAASAVSEAKTRPGLYGLALLVSSFVSYVVVNEIICFKARIPGLPGPPRLPLVGNLHQLRSNAAQKYRDWAKEYGPVYQIQLGNVPVLLVNSAAAARTILGTNSAATASRPELYTFHKVSISGAMLVSPDIRPNPEISWSPTRQVPPSARHHTMSL